QKAAHERAAAERSAASAQSALDEQAAVDSPNASAGAASATDKDADLLATVDSDVSQQVPSAMQPLAQLMDDNGTK
ncbi:MAG: hypothetical protein WBC92_20115, partial [Terracidiphilus sp.]